MNLAERSYNPAMPVELILGGARSGKSRCAEQRALDSGLAVTLIATAAPGDVEMRARIDTHRARRPNGWRTVEVSHDLAAAVAREARDDACVIVDCLTLWLSNLLSAGNSPGPDVGVIEAPAGFEAALAGFLEILPSLPGKVILISNEIGFGVVPLGALTRFFADEMGRLNQNVASRVARVTLMVAGLALELKP